MRFFYFFSIVILSIYCIVVCNNTRFVPYEAFVIVPVADLLEKPSHALFNFIKPNSIYEFLPLCGGYEPHPSYACPRVHQILFNEIVEVAEEKGDEVGVKTFNAFHLYRNENNRSEIPNVNLLINRKNKPLNVFWTLKKNIKPLRDIEKKDLIKIPVTLSFTSKSKQLENVVTLALPFFDQKTNTHYSAGTRFIKSDNQHEDDLINVFIFDNRIQDFVVSSIPRYVCIKEVHSKHDKIKQFVGLIRFWANQEQGYIPYVWGGTSFIHLTNQEQDEKTMCLGSTETSFFTIAQFNHIPKSGFDCSGIINRAAQVCGIPFYIRLSSSIATILDELQSGEDLRNGDIIWKPFHVFVVTNVENNLLLEARGYGNGEGRVHEVLLHKVFKDIYTYDQLIEAFHAKKMIYRLDKDGEILQEVPDFKLLKLESIWNNN